MVAGRSAVPIGDPLGAPQLPHVAEHLAVLDGRLLPQPLPVLASATAHTAHTHEMRISVDGVCVCVCVCVVCVVCRVSCVSCVCCVSCYLLVEGEGGRALPRLDALGIGVGEALLFRRGRELGLARGHIDDQPQVVLKVAATEISVSRTTHDTHAVELSLRPGTYLELALDVVVAVVAVHRAVDLRGWPRQQLAAHAPHRTQSTRVVPVGRTRRRVWSGAGAPSPGP